MKKNVKPLALSLVAAGAIPTPSAQAVEFEPMGKALTTLLKTTKVSKKSFTFEGRDTPVFYSKDASGKVTSVAVLEKGIYEPNCTHTWAIGLDPTSGAVTEVRTIEMSCQHAFPTREKSFLEQFVGKGPADAQKIEEDTDVIAKATGSSKLAATAVRRAITVYQTQKKAL